MEIQLPANLDAERAVLGSILMDRDAIMVVQPVLACSDFYLEKHRYVYAAAVACFARRVPPDLQTVAEALRAAGHLAAVGDLAFLVELSNSVPTALHAEYYAQIVAHLAYCRRLIQAGGKIAALGYDSSRDGTDLQVAAMGLLRGATGPHAAGGFIPLGEAIKRRLAGFGGPVRPGLSTGLEKLDRKLGGVGDGNLITIAAETGVGKTALALYIAHFNSVVLGKRGGIVSLEMADDELADRLLALHAGVDSRRVRVNNATDAELALLVQAAGEIQAAPLFITTATATLESIRAAAAAASVDGPLAYLIVDYLQLVGGNVRGNANRTTEVGQVSRGLKLLAGELGCPVFALSQLKRPEGTKKRTVPELDDLRESGSIQHDSDGVIFIVREQGSSLVALHLAKWRHGALGVAPAWYQPITGQWSDLVDDRQQAGLSVTA